MDSLSKYSDQIKSMLVEYAPKFIFAVLLLVVGLWLIKKVIAVAKIGFERRKFDKSLVSFLSSIISLGLKVLLIITVAGMVGIQTTSVIALLGAAGLAVGLALQGSLANFAGGVLILMFKPYIVGDTVEVMAQKGVVTDIQIFHTILRGDEDKTIIIPNGPLLNGVIINITSKHL
ncbi:MAG: mechanosensitive ion channel [Bacteroidetes bacterium]|nr:mechanosensitive ion channel [Bacteroidota bacterium]